MQHCKGVCKARTHLYEVEQANHILRVGLSQHGDLGFEAFPKLGAQSFRLYLLDCSAPTVLPVARLPDNGEGPTPAGS